MSYTPDQQDLVNFSREVADYILQFMQFYPDLFAAVAYLMGVESSPSTESELMEVRTAAGNMGGIMTLFSRTIDSSVNTYTRQGIEAQFHPLPVRALVQDMAESCILLSRVMSLQDLSGIPLITPAELSEKLEKPQIAAWIQVNQSPVFEQQGPTALTDPGPATPPAEPVPQPPPPAQPNPVDYPAPAAPADNPYPPTDPTDPPAPPPAPVEPPLPPEPRVAPPPGEDAWRAPGPPGGIPGDRSR